MTRPAYDWLMSGYDETWHVFLDEQLADPEQSFLAALCEHSVPVQCVEHTAPGELCPACVRALGELLPEGSPWGMAD